MRTIHILVSLLALFVLYAEFFMLDSLDLEKPYVFLLSILLFSRLLALIKLKEELKITILGLADFALVGMSILNFSIVPVLIFGYSYSTGKIPVILAFGIIVNVGVMISCSIELLRIMIGKQ
ncbi:MAG: hypothetical protein ACI85I_001817 [Arenicella sp.]|jgi:hypothetical protein